MKTIQKIVLETVPVILGVLIALFIGDWKAERDDMIYMERMVKSMKEEAEVNLKDLNEIIPTHIRMIDTINTYIADENISVMTLIGKNEGFKLPTINNRTWNAVISNRVELVDIETLKTVSSIDELKDLSKMKLDVLSDFIYENLESNDEGSKAMLRIHFSNLIETEIQLVKYHVNFLELENYTNEWLDLYEIDLNNF